MRPSFEKVSLLNGSPTLVRPALPVALSGLNSAVFSFAIAASDRGLAGGRIEPLTLRRREDDVEDGALLGRELRLDQVGRLLGVGARDRELVAQASRRSWRRGRSGSTMIPTQVTTTRHGLPAHMRIQRARAPVASRSCAARRSVVPLSSCCRHTRPYLLDRWMSLPTLPSPVEAGRYGKPHLSQAGSRLSRCRAGTG